MSQKNKYQKAEKTSFKTQNKPEGACKMSDQLSGINEIAAYFRRSVPTIIKLIQTEGFPAKKILGVWESDKSLIERWRIKYLEDEN